MMKKALARLKRWYYDLRINMKLNLTNVLIISIPMLILSVLVNKISTEVIVDKSINSTVQGLLIVSRSIDSVLSQVEYLSGLVATNDNLQKSLQIPENNQYELLVNRSEVIKSLDSIVGDRNIIYSVTIFNDDGVLFNSTHVDPHKISNINLKMESLVKTVKEGKGKNIWISTRPISYYRGNTSIDCFSLYRVLINGLSGEAVGAIEINVTQDTISRIFSISGHGEFQNILIINEEGIVVSSAQKEELYKKIDNESYFQWVVNNQNTGKIFNVGKDKYLITSVENSRLGWYLVGFTHWDDITKDNGRVTKLIFFISMVCLLLATITSIFNSRTLTKPIINLSKHMAIAADGNLETCSEILGNDEIGNLTKNFNYMITQISSLIEKVYKEQKKKEEFKLLALQSQINPHFLYNTLDSICALAKISRNEKIYDMVKSLSIFYRSVLSEGRSID